MAAAAAAAGALPSASDKSKEEDSDPVADAIDTAVLLPPSRVMTRAIREALQKKPSFLNLAFPGSWCKPANSFLPLSCVQYAATQWIDSASGPLKDVVLIADTAFRASRLLNRVEEALHELKWVQNTAVRRHNVVSYAKSDPVRGVRTRVIRTCANLDVLRGDSFDAAFVVSFGVDEKLLIKYLIPATLALPGTLCFIAGPWPLASGKPQIRLQVLPDAGAVPEWKSLSVKQSAALTNLALPGLTRMQDVAATPVVAAAAAAAATPVALRSTQKRPRLTLAEVVAKLSTS